jgi:hypothetical protein
VYTCGQQANRWKTARARLFPSALLNHHFGGLNDHLHGITLF